MKGTIQEEWREFKKDMFCEPFAVSGFVNGTAPGNIMVDSGCLSYALCDSRFAQKNNLQRISVPPLGLEGFNGSKSSVAKEVAILDLDLDGYSERVFAYITPISGHDVFLGLPWIYKRNVTLQGNKKQLQIRSSRTHYSFSRSSSPGFQPDQHALYYFSSLILSND